MMCHHEHFIFFLQVLRDFKNVLFWIYQDMSRYGGDRDRGGRSRWGGGEVEEAGVEEVVGVGGVWVEGSEETEEVVEAV